MKCAWTQLLTVIPAPFRDVLANKQEGSVQELRISIGQPCEIILKDKRIWTTDVATKADIDYCINIASKFSPWSVSTLDQGYITAPGGHRIGICGEVIVNGHGKTVVKNVTSLIIRVANQIDGVASGVHGMKGSSLIMGKPGSGKTTMLRDLVKRRAANGEHIVVVDERTEIFPLNNGSFVFPPGKGVSVMSGCNKPWGIDRALKVMSPDTIALDEITSFGDSRALASASGCGVSLIATAHGNGMRDFCTRMIYRQLYELRIFDTLISMYPDKSWSEEVIHYNE